MQFPHIQHLQMKEREGSTPCDITVILLLDGKTPIVAIYNRSDSHGSTKFWKMETKPERNRRTAAHGFLSLLLKLRRGLLQESISYRGGSRRSLA